MASAVAEAQRILPQFKAAVQTGASAAAQARDLLVRLKIAITGFPYQNAADGAAPSEQEVALAREILELAVILCTQTGDGAGLERNIAQLKQYYSSQTETQAQTQNRQHVTGLHLMHLLVEARLPEFHSQVESLSAADRSSPFVAFPLRLDTFLQEGSYNKILAARTSVPSPQYIPFFDKLAHTVRDDIAECAAAAYQSLSVDAAVKMMMFKDRNELAAYVNEKGLEWTLTPGGAGGGVIRFSSTDKSKPEVDALTLMKNTIHYATELERIV